MENNSRGSTTSLGASSRSKRSTTNLANLRLAPLSSKYADPTTPTRAKPASDESSDTAFLRSHSSYLQGKSAPTTPGILSRSSSRRQIHGLSRRSSIYDNDPADVINYEYAGVVRDTAGGVSLEISSGRVPKAKSEAALLVQRQRAAQKGSRSQLASSGVRHHSRKGTDTGGSTTPRATKTKGRDLEDHWITRTGVAANAIVQESKGQSWMGSKSSSVVSFTQPQESTSDEEEDDDDDEGYEELAALSASTTQGQLADDELTPVNTRVGGWGSRYGSRTGSRRTSRRGSFTGSRSNLAPLSTLGGADARLDEYVTAAVEPDFVDSEEELDDQDDAAVSRITDDPSFGFGGIVDRLMNFNLFKVEEKEEATDDEGGHVGETDAQAAERMAAENRRKREEKARLLNRPTGEGEQPAAGEGEGGWSDAAWLLSVASKVMF